MFKTCVYKNPECKCVQYDGTNHDEIEAEWGNKIGNNVYSDKSFHVRSEDSEITYCEVGDFIVEYDNHLAVHSEELFYKHFNIKE